MSASQEYIDFMLGKKTTSKRHASSSPAHFTPPAKPERNSSISSPRGQSSVRSIQKAFVLTLMEWLELDDQIYGIVLSTSNLRDRIWHTSRMLNEMANTASPFLESSSSWKKFGYQSEDAPSSFGSRLTKDDLDMAMDHSLLHHERMMRELRHRISSLNIVQEKLGRRYDELYRAASAVEFISDTLTDKAPSVNKCQELLISAAKELYRKQSLGKQIIETAVMDSLLCATDEGTTNSTTLLAGMEEEDRNPRQVAQECCTLWPREHQMSHLYGHVSHLKELLLQYAK
jgi:hypothetical protein